MRGKGISVHESPVFQDFEQGPNSMFISLKSRELTRA